MINRLALTLLAAQALFAAVNYSYDAAGRLTKIDYGAGVSITYSYDKAGNLLSRTTAAAAAGTPAVVGTQQPFGATTTQSFTFQYSHSSGAQNLSVLNVLINNFLDGRHACYLAYVVASSTLILVDDGGDAGGPYAGSVALGSPGTTIQNSQCGVNLVSAVGTGNAFSLGLNITFGAAFGGNKIQYMAARDATNNTGWQAMGVWQPPFTPGGTISITSLNQQRTAAAAGTSETLAFTLADTKTAADFRVIPVLISNFIDGRQACYLAYVASSNTLLLIDDAGDAAGPYAGTMPMTGGTVPISNSQCSVNPAGSSVAMSGNNLVLTLNITAKSGTAANRVVYVAGRDKLDGNNTDWQSLGTWTVQ